MQLQAERSSAFVLLCLLMTVCIFTFLCIYWDMRNFFHLLDLNRTVAKGYLSAYAQPWEALVNLKAYLRGLGNTLDRRIYEEIDHEVWIHRGASIAPSACLRAPCIVGEGTEIRHCAYLRGGVLVGKNCVVGNSTEVKNSILFDGVKAPHFNYVGDSILGVNAHLGASSILSNVRADGGLVTVHCAGENLETGLKKFGAIVGDHAEIGCGAVVNPGSIVGKRAFVYPLSCVRGEIPENHIYKNGEIFAKRGYRV